MSHFCEKIRWVLARWQIPYREEAHFQGFHYIPSFLHGRTPFVPILIDGTKVITDSSVIMAYLDESFCERESLYPDTQKTQIRELEELFNETLGVETRRWVYLHMLHHPKIALATATQKVPAWQRMAATPLFPFAGGFIKKRLSVTAENVQAGEQKIRQIFQQVEELLSDGRPYLCGDQFTAADLTFASMTAPITLPREYGIRLPTHDELPHPMKDIARELADSRAGKFALRMFHEEKNRS